MANLADIGLVYKGIRPLQKLGAQARDLAETLNYPLKRIREEAPRHLLVVPPDPWAGDSQRGRDMIAGIFRFGGQTIARDSLSWEPLGAKPEWLYDLHSFEFLRDLRSVGGDRARRMAREMVASWLDHYVKLSGPTARPDIIGVRLSSWMSFHDFFCASADDTFRESYFISLVRQAKYLQRVLPGHLTGISLMRALKGLAYSGLALEGGEERLESAFRLILREIRDQILPDGCHVSRNPQSTFEFLQILVDLRTALNAARLPMPDELQHAIDRIAPAVKFFRHGCGALAHFNGAQEGNPHICDATLMHSGARGKAMKSLPHGGFDKIYQGRAQVLMDIGLPPTAPKYSERAHAGLLSFEYSYGKDRVFVNCGSSPLKGTWRDMLRTTAAHTALVVDCRNIFQLDDKGQLTEKVELTHRKSEDTRVALLEASHTGYRTRLGLMHRRRLCLTDNGDVLSGEDTLAGRSGVPYTLRFHLHPAIQASLVQEGSEVLLRARSGMGWRFTAPGATLALEESVHVSCGEAPRRTLQIVISGVTASENDLRAWELKREKLAPSA